MDKPCSVKAFSLIQTHVAVFWNEPNFHSPSIVLDVHQSAPEWHVYLTFCLLSSTIEGIQDLLHCCLAAFHSVMCDPGDLVDHFHHVRVNGDYKSDEITLLHNGRNLRAKWPIISSEILSGTLIYRMLQTHIE